jgi:hypothetical protein
MSAVLRNDRSVFVYLDRHASPQHAFVIEVGEDRARFSREQAGVLQTVLREGAFDPNTRVSLCPCRYGCPTMHVVAGPGEARFLVIRDAHGNRLVLGRPMELELMDEAKGRSWPTL